eukprot:TRINITY_DN5786_c0_g1_i3.p1 TRINITY_DN5786_c0_g1~~TRINITY_DN5786_c0_g1_i3.p1  ORF type:complete len:492 (+),score=64.86 TRINITY_DN5786_c0_g1_i3:50-1525(+)
MSFARMQPPWLMPTATQMPRVKVLNSLTKTKVPLIPSEGNVLKWYACGPTVYDSPHLGHARTYIIFDVIRRILRDYFQYEIFMVMNVTDIDDKIIVRANETQQDFRSISRMYEKEFFDDMQALGVLPPDVITRVSEYIPEIIAFIQGLFEKEFAYESEGSVYFDTTKFNDTDIHFYGKLEPNSVGNEMLLNEGEGALSVPGGKKNRNDFAIWKKSKDGEPRWSSPWGDGRPGWHIECSAMASDILGSSVDVHSGGCDLRFPHHDNELAQSEAYFGIRQWVNYFLHSGHLNIDGLKMSKALRNFVKIRTMLDTYSPRQIRLFFMSYKYDAPVDVTERGMKQAVEKDRKFIEFFHDVKIALRMLPLEAPQRWDQKDKKLNEELLKAKSSMHDYLYDNLNIPAALNELLELVNRGNVYMKDSNPHAPLLRAVADYITKMLRVFGLITDDNEIGYSSQVSKKLEEVVSNPLTAFTEFRDQIRAHLRSNGRGKPIV